MKRRTRRIAMLCALVTAAAVAYAAVDVVGESLVAEPPVIVRLGAGTGGTALDNNGTTNITIVDLERDPGCAMTDGTPITASAGTPFTIAPSDSPRAAQVICPNGGPSGTMHGIRRCQFHPNKDNTPTGRIGSFTTICVYQAVPHLGTTTSIDFGMVPLNGASAVAMYPVMTMSAVSSVYYSITDQDGNFEITSPCLNSSHCVATQSAGAGGMFTYSIRCTPKRTGMITASLHIVGNAGQHLPSPVSLICNGTDTGGMAPDISVSKSTVSLMQNAGGATVMDSFTIKNVGDQDLDITGITKTGSAWTMMISPACSPSCTLAPNDELDVTMGFTPPSIGSLDGNVQISSTDPDSMTVNVTLDGTGLGSTLALETNLGSPPKLDLGTAPVGTPLMSTIAVKNDPGNTDLPVTVTATPANVFSVDRASFTINAGIMEPIEVTCVPNAPQLITGMLVVDGPTAFQGSPLMIDLECRGTNGNLFAMPSSIAFDEIRVGSGIQTRVVELHTNGPMLTISQQPSISPSVTGMSVTTAAPSMLTTAAPASFTLSVDPTADRNLATSISVTAGADTIAIPVTGKVVTPAITVPDLENLGTYCVSSPPKSGIVRMLASGTASINMATKPVLAKGMASPFSIAYTLPTETAYPYRVPAGASAMIEVQPQPSPTATTIEDDILWTTDMPGNPTPRTKVQATFVEDGGAIAPGTADFGGIPVRQLGEPKTITIQNCGDEPMMLGLPRIEPRGEFTNDSADPLPAMLAPNQTAAMTIGFKPTGVGLRTATLTVDTPAMVLRVDLRGTGLGNGTSDGARKSLYACSSSTPTGILAMLFAVLFVVLPRRRR